MGSEELEEEEGEDEGGEEQAPGPLLVGAILSSGREQSETKRKK